MSRRLSSGSDVDVVPARRAPVGDEGLRDFAEMLVTRARDEGVQLTGEGGLLTGLVTQVLSTGLEIEMADHLGYEAHDVTGRGSEVPTSHLNRSLIPRIPRHRNPFQSDSQRPLETALPGRTTHG
jgi:hypothetical protein